MGFENGSRPEALTWPQGAGFTVGSMKVAEVIRRSGVSRKALRVYETRGILPAPRRTPAGYREYTADVLGVLTFVQQGRRLGLTLAEIKHIIGLRRSRGAPCAHVRTLLQQREADLKALLAEVRAILKAWPSTKGRLAVVCPHIEARGGDSTWNGTPSVRCARTVRKSSSMARSSGSVKTPIRPSSRETNGTSSSG
jgi:DNA-binding transcriptional MerR regulator